MFERFFAPPRRMPRSVEEELHSLCHATQIEVLSRLPRLRRDPCADCGCDPYADGPPQARAC